MEAPGWEWINDLDHRRYEEEQCSNMLEQQDKTQSNCNYTQRGTNMRISDQYASNWLKASDLQGKPRTVTIERVELETIGQGDRQQEKPVCYFQGKDKGLVLNKTNGQTIAASLGDETMAWTGRQIVLMSTKVPFQGQMVDAIRISVPVDQQGSSQAAAAAPATTADDFDDDIPFVCMTAGVLCDEEKTVFQMRQRQAARGLL